MGYRNFSEKKGFSNSPRQQKVNIGIHEGKPMKNWRFDIRIVTGILCVILVLLGLVLFGVLPVGNRVMATKEDIPYALHLNSYPLKELPGAFFSERGAVYKTPRPLITELLI